jgi:amidohydrolase
MTNRSVVPSVTIAAFAAISALAQGALPGEVNMVYPAIERLYVDLHQTPELSLAEVKTAEKMAAALRALAFEVTTNVGGYGVVGILRNGPGPVVMLRTELDALPVEEKTGLPYASTVRAKDPVSGDVVPVMHACGHDVHMSAWVGTATIMAASRDSWSGTLVMVGQPAEERARGARAMLEDGLFTRFPRPDFALAVHDDDRLPAGEVGFTSGYALAAVDSVSVTIFGKGGHGAAPHMTVDPIVIAAKCIIGFQTVVSREKDPIKPGLITVGAIHGGTKNNIIPDHVDMLLTVRSFRPEVQERLLAGIKRVIEAEAEEALAPRPPTMQITESTRATVNEPALASRLRPALERALGAPNVVDAAPVTASEDFSEYGAAGVPAFILRAGAVPPQLIAEVKGDVTKLPSLHSPTFAPDREPTIKTSITAEVAMLRELMKK